MDTRNFSGDAQPAHMGSLARKLKLRQLEQEIRAEEMARSHRPAQQPLRPDWIQAAGIDIPDSRKDGNKKAE